MEILIGSFGILLMVIVAIVSLFDGIDMPSSGYIGQTVEVFPVTKIVNYSRGGIWQNDVNYLQLKNNLPDHAGTVSYISKRTKFIVTRVRLSHSGLSMTLSKMCYFTEIRKPHRYFVDKCGDIKAINQTTEYLESAQRYFEKNQVALVVAKPWSEIDVKKVFEVNRAAIYEARSFDDFLKIQVRNSYNYEGILYEHSYLIPHSFELKESEFYKFDYGNSVDSLNVYEETKNFKKNLIPDNLLAWLSNSYPNDLDTRWVLKLLYILSKTEYIPENFEYCFEKILKFKNVGRLIDKFNDETNARIKISGLHSSTCNFKKPTVLDDRFSIVSN